VIIDLVRLAKAVHLSVQHQGDGVFTVTGGASPHTVDGESCDCDDHRIRGGRCKHILATLLHQGDPEVLARLRDLVPQERKRTKRIEFVPVEEASEPLVPLGAFAQWQLEIMNGERGQRADRPSTWIMDDLWRAAAYEATALEAERNGELIAARDAMDKAIHILAESHDRDSVAA
jgi:hypothetical protein